MRFELRYRGEAESVRVRGSVEAAGEPLRRDGGEWVTALELPADVRAVYWFALDGEEDWARWLPDPANPRRYAYPPSLWFTNGREVVGSLLEGPEAPPYRWTVPRDVPHGELTAGELDGRRVWRYLPPAAPEALALVFDGSAYTTLAPVQTVLDNLLAEGLVPPTAAVLVDSGTHERRFAELDRHAGFLSWCCDRLLPWAEVEAPPERTLVAGSSMGGLAASWFAAERPDLFGGAIVQSGGFPGRPVQVPAGLPVRFYLDVGLLEDTLLGSTRELRDDLLGKGYEVAYREFPGGHDFFWWGETIADGLRALLRPTGEPR